MYGEVNGKHAAIAVLYSDDSDGFIGFPGSHYDNVVAIFEGASL